MRGLHALQVHSLNSQSFSSRGQTFNLALQMIIQLQPVLSCNGSGCDTPHRRPPAAALRRVQLPRQCVTAAPAMYDPPWQLMSNTSSGNISIKPQAISSLPAARGPFWPQHNHPFSGRATRRCPPAACVIRPSVLAGLEHQSYLRATCAWALYGDHQDYKLQM